MVGFEPLNEESFQNYLKGTLISYAEAHVRAGNWEVSESIQRAEEQIRQLLPQGFSTEGHHFLKIVDDVTEEKVGVIWFAKVENEEEKVVFLYDLVIEKRFRQHGYGKQALYSLEKRVSTQGFNAIYLHVFAFNQVAKSLYDDLGYEVAKTYYDEDSSEPTSFRMMKEIRSSS